VFVVVNTVPQTSQDIFKMLFFWILVVAILLWRLKVSHDHFSKVPKAVPWSNGRFVPYLLTQISAIWNSPKTIGKAYQKAHLLLQKPLFLKLMPFSV
jgi:hypothetical protein